MKKKPAKQEAEMVKKSIWLSYLQIQQLVSFYDILAELGLDIIKIFLYKS